MKDFKDELDVLMLADMLHDKECKKFHGADRLDMVNIEDKCFYHNRNIELSQRVKQVSNQRFIQKSKDILTMCENMNMQQIVKLVNTIMNDAS